MRTHDEVKKELELLISEIRDLIIFTMLDEFDPLGFNSRYQKWYTKASKLVELLGPDRLQEFIGYYRADPRRKTIEINNYVIHDFINGIQLGDYPEGYPIDDRSIMRIRIMNQGDIIGALSSRIDTVLADVTGHLLSEIEDFELEAASKLTKVSLRAAGSLAGVVLERHLQRVAINHQVTISKRNPTIADLNDPLKDRGIYELATWRKIQFLADIRNICSHQKSIEPTVDQVKVLISGVNAIVKTIF
jgi:hypothetical protein